jgi:hypothetical protein
MKKSKILLLMLLSLGVFTACTSSSTPAVSKIARSADFKLGQQDGCTTASGEYSKNRELFKNNTQYNDGWFYGRKQCNPSNSKK